MVASSPALRPMSSSTPAAPSSRTPSSAGGHAAIQRQLKAMSYDEGAALLAPPGGARGAPPGAPVQQQQQVPTPRPTKQHSYEEAMALGLLGNAPTLDGAFRQAGKPLEGLAPQVNNGFEASFQLQQNNGVCYTDLKVEGGVRRTPAGYEIEGKVTGVLGKALGTTQTFVYAGARVQVGVKAQGDSVTECLDIIAVALMSQLKSMKVPDSVFANVFSPGYAGRVAAGMDAVGMKGAGGSDEEDSCEFMGSLAATAGGQTGGKDNSSVRGGVGAAGRAKFAKEGAGGPKFGMTGGAVTFLEGTFAHQGATFSFEGQTFDSKSPKLSELELKIELAAPSDQIIKVCNAAAAKALLAKLPGFCAPMLPRIVDAILGMQKLADPKRRVGSLGVGVAFKVATENGKSGLKELRAYSFASGTMPFGPAEVSGKKTHDAFSRKY